MSAANQAQVIGKEFHVVLENEFENGFLSAPT